MAVAILSPVSMRAQDYPFDVNIELADSDFDLLVDEYPEANGDGSTTYNSLLANVEDLIEYVGDDEIIADYIDEKGYGNVNLSVTVYDNKNGGKPIYEDVDFRNQRGILDNKITTDVSIVLEVTVDYLAHKNPASTLKSDGKDDRDQHIISVSTEEWNYRADKPAGTYTEVTTSTQFVANDKTDATKWVSMFPGYGDVRTVDGDRYKLVYYVESGDLKNVKGDVKVVAKWEINPEERLVNGSPKPEVVYDELDTNHDGVVSCDEAHGEGWVWNEDKKACVYTGSTTSTVIVNTATK